MAKSPRTGNIERQDSEAEAIRVEDGENINAKRVGNYIIGPDGNWQPDMGVPASGSTRIDDTASPIIYIGKAPLASVTSTASWQIAKLDTSSGLIKTFADGNAEYDNIWDNRTSLTYS